MGNILQETIPRTTAFSGQLASEQTGNCDNWFTRACRKIYPKDAGLQLHLATSIELRTCYRYASGQRVPSGGLLMRQLLRGRDGQLWLDEIMKDSDALWWREYQLRK